MNILIIHEVDWLKKVTYEIHHLSELFSLSGHRVFAIDVTDPKKISLDKSLFQNINNYNRVYKDAKVTLLRTPIVPIKGLHRIVAYLSSYGFIKKNLKKNDIDIVFLFGVVTNGKATIKACKELNVPVVHRTLDVIIEKINDILQEIPDFKLLIIGGGPDLNFFKEIVKTKKLEDIVIFTGFVSYLEVPKYCSLAKLFINPFKINEITNRLSPVKIFDLLSCGKPVIATPLEGLLHDFPRDSNILIYSELEDFDKNIIGVLKKESLEDIGNRGREFVEKNFTWTRVVEKTLEEFSEIIKYKKKHRLV